MPFANTQIFIRSNLILVEILGSHSYASGLHIHWNIVLYRFVWNKSTLLFIENYATPAVYHIPGAQNARLVVGQITPEAVLSTST